MDIGIYPIAMASLVFGGGRPESIKANGYLTDTGVDELVSVIIKYPGIEEMDTLAKYRIAQNFNGGKV